MSDELMRAAMRAGGRLADGLAEPTAMPHSLRYATLVSVEGGKATVEMMGGALAGLDMAVGAASAAPGDRVVVETYGTLAIVTGVVLSVAAGYARPLFEWTNSWTGTPEVFLSEEQVQDVYVPGPVVCEVYAAVGGTGEYGMALSFSQDGALKGRFSATSPSKNGGTLRWTANGVLTLEPGIYTVSATTSYWGSVNIVGGDSSGNSAMPIDASFPAGVPRYMRVWQLPAF